MRMRYKGGYHRKVTLLTLIVLILSAGELHAYSDKPRKPTPVSAAGNYALHETHSGEHVTIAVQPGDTDELNPDTRLSTLR